MMNNFYVYIYLDPRKYGIFKYENYTFNNEPFYIGKGCKNRYLKHLQNCSIDKNFLKINKINKLKRLNINPIIIIYKNKLTEHDAYILESEMIKSIGRLDIKTGPLTNLTDGGVCGYKNLSDELKYSYGSSTRGKTYEEIYGYEKAKILKNKRAESNRHRNVRKKTDTTFIKNIYEINLDITIKTQHNDIWVLFSPKNYVYITRNLLKTCEELKIRRGSISKLGRGILNYYKGWYVEIYNSNNINEIKKQITNIHPIKYISD